MVFHSHFTTLCCCSYTDQWMGRDMHNGSGHIDHATIEQFRQGDFADQTQHVKKAFCFCMLTLMACVNKTWQRRDIRNSYMLCQKTTATDEAIVCRYLHSYLDKWIREFQEEEFSAAKQGLGKTQLLDVNTVLHVAREEDTGSKRWS